VILDEKREKYLNSPPSGRLFSPDNGGVKRG
jgi:hypothetical protein